MDVVCCTDNKFIMPIGIMLKSLCENNIDVTVHVIIDENVTEDSKKSLESIVKSYKSNDIFFYLINGSFFNDFPSLNVVSRITKATYYRLLLASILPEHLNKVLFLDGDIIVRKNLSSLWESNISHVAVGCVIDHEVDDIDLYNRLLYAPEYGYFNAGVLLINLSYWRNNDLTNKFFQYISEYPERIKYHDQDVLNVVLHDKKVFLPITYNAQTSFFYKNAFIKYNIQKYGDEVVEMRKDPFIVHYSAGFKPWNYDCAHPYRSSFLYYKSLTQWKDISLKKEYYPTLTLRAIFGEVLRYLGLRKKILIHKSYLFFDKL